MPERAHASDEIDRYVDAFATAAGPMLTNLGFSGVAGICVGKAIKVVSGMVALFLGIAFVATQVAASQGIISVNWTDIEHMVTKSLDQNKDGCAFLQSMSGLALVTFACSSFWEHESTQACPEDSCRFFLCRACRVFTRPAYCFNRAAEAHSCML